MWVLKGLLLPALGYWTDHPGTDHYAGSSGGKPSRHNPLGLPPKPKDGPAILDHIKNWHMIL
jgi:hypothetical protein